MVVVVVVLVVVGVFEAFGFGWFVLVVCFILFHLVFFFGCIFVPFCRFFV